MLKQLFLFVVVCVSLVGCQTRRALLPFDEVTHHSAPDTNRLVSFPAPVLYVLAREYENLTDSTTPKYHSPQSEILRQQADLTIQEYMEQRLLQLFPNVAYKGMLAKISEASQILLKEQQPDFSINFNELSSLHPTNEPPMSESVHLYQSEADEIHFLGMTPVEQRTYESLNSLADSAGFAQTKDFQHITIEDSVWSLNRCLLSDSIPFFLEENLGISLLLSGLGSAMFYRVMQSKARAEYVAEFYYPGATKDGTRGDAFKHLFVNMMLRRYTSEPLTRLIMDIYWERVGNNAPCDMVMDLHNNRVGRSERYWMFRGDLLQDAYNWQAWSENILRFVEDTTSNSAYQSWNKQLPMHYIQASQKKANPSLYLYWNKSVAP